MCICICIGSTKNTFLINMLLIYWISKTCLVCVYLIIYSFKGFCAKICHPLLEVLNSVAPKQNRNFPSPLPDLTLGSLPTPSPPELLHCRVWRCTRCRRISYAASMSLECHGLLILILHDALALLCSELVLVHIL